MFVRLFFLHILLNFVTPGAHGISGIQYLDNYVTTVNNLDQGVQINKSLFFFRLKMFKLFLNRQQKKLIMPKQKFSKTFAF